MKFIKRIAAVCVAAIGLIPAAGCKQKTYYVYTNIPQNDFEILDKNYTVGGLIEGCTVEKPVAENLETSGYTAWAKSYFYMLADANAVVAGDFSSDDKAQTRTEFFNGISEKLNEIDKALSTTVADSDISLFNGAKAGATLEISKITYEVLSLAKSVYEFTGGYYNPALYYNVQAYGFGGASDYPHSAEQLPKDEVIEKYTELASHFDEVSPYESENKYFVKKPDKTVQVDGETLSMKLDLGGIGKGYAVDCVDELFDKFGYSYGYFDFGSSSMLIKRNVLEDVYTMSFSSPRSPSRSPYIKTSIRNQKLSSSGDDVQRYFIDGVRYCHVIDPTTGKPVQTGVMSASIIGGSAAEDDALTTAIMAMGRDKAITFIKERLTDRKVVFTYE